MDYSKWNSFKDDDEENEIKKISSRKNNIQDNISNDSNVIKSKDDSIKKINNNSVSKLMKEKDLSADGLLKFMKDKTNGLNINGLMSGGVFDDNNTLRQTHLHFLNIYSSSDEELNNNKEQMMIAVGDDAFIQDCPGLKFFDSNNAEGGEVTKGNRIFTTPDLTSSNFVCSKSLTELKNVESIKSLKKSCISYGNVLHCTIVEPTFRVAGIQILVEDSCKQLFTLVVYNYVTERNSLAKIQELFPLGASIAIKEPYLKCLQTGRLGIRVDHPKNIEVTIPDHSWWSTVIGPTYKSIDQVSNEKLKQLGNDQFKEKNYNIAIKLYSYALENLNKNNPDDNYFTLLCNRSACYLKVCQYDPALFDVNEILIRSNSTTITTTYNKALFRKAEALYGLRQYNQSHHCFMELLKILDKIDNTRKSIDNKLKILQKRLKQQLNGDVEDEDFISGDFDNYFHSSLSVNYSPGKGRGVFLTENVAANTILVVEKSFVTQSKDEKEYEIVSIDFGKESVKGSGAHQRVMIQKVLEETKSSLPNYARVSILYDGKEENRFLPNLDLYRNDSNIDNKFELFLGMDKLTVEKINGILIFNCFQDDNKELSRHLYIFSSLFNHNVNPNTYTVNKENGTIIIKAKIDLKAGDEVCGSYGKEEELSQWGITPANIN